MLRRLFGEGKFDAKDLATYFAVAALVYLGVAIVLFNLGGDDDGGTGPKPEPKPSAPAPPIVPDRPPAEWFAKC